MKNALTLAKTLLTADIDSLEFKAAWMTVVETGDSDDVDQACTLVADRFLGSGWTFEDEGEIARAADGRALDYCGYEVPVIMPAGWVRE